VEEDLAKGASPGGQQPRVLIQGGWASVA